MKIMAICGSGLGSSFMVEMNIKKVLKKMGVEAEVEHSDLSSATPGAADVFVMAKDIADSASVPGPMLSAQLDHNSPPGRAAVCRTAPAR